MPDFAGDRGGELRRKARSLEWICTLECASYLILLAWWIPKLLGNDSLTVLAGVRIMGFLHGFIVMAFAAMVLMITPALRWKWWWSALMILLGPIGAVLVFERLRRTRPILQKA
ncbi:MAG: DUF3817 domain-containing protein [Acidimicrobiia bacterium]|jgi:hypothetical protein